MTVTYHRLRRFVGTTLLAALLCLPFLKVNGESAFRFDIPTLRLLFFGSQVGLADFFVILIAVIFLIFFILLMTVLFGRIWCGWLCPQTILCDATVQVEPGRRRRTSRYSLAVAWAIAVSALISFSVIACFVAPADIPRMLRTGGLAANILWWSWFVMTVLIALDLLLVRRNFCATVCPYARLQGVLFDDRTLLVAFDTDRAGECMGCRACVTACPVGIDIRNGIQSACIHCAECIDACSRRFARKQRPSLISYSFGVPGPRTTGQPVNVLVMGLMTLISLAFLVWLLSSKMPFDATVRLAYTGEPRYQADGSITNTYEVSLRNLTRDEIELRFAVSPGPAAISPGRVVLRPGQDIVRIPAAVTVQTVKDGHDRELTLHISSERPERTVSRKIYFLLPNGPQEH